MVGQNEHSGAKLVNGNFYLYAKNQGILSDKTLFYHCNRKSKTDDPVIICFLAFTPETSVT